MHAEIVIPDWARHIVSDHTDMDRSPYPVDSSKVSSFRFRLPDDAYFEYAFLDDDGTMRADPRNPERAKNPWFKEASALFGPHYRPSEYSDVGGREQRGSLDRHRLDSSRLGETRRLSVYTPQEGASQPLPLVLVHDGPAFLRVANLHLVLDALLAEGRIRPARLAFIEPVDRMQEYLFDEHYREFTLEELLPFIETRYSGTGERIAMGASLGGLFSATVGVLAPDVFAAVIAFSGAFLGTPSDRDPYRATESWVVQRIQESDRLPLAWYTEVGTFEWLTEVNRSVTSALDERGYRHGYRERNAGHNWVNWRNGLADALLFALGNGNLE